MLRHITVWGRDRMLILLYGAMAAGKTYALGELADDITGSHAVLGDDICFKYPFPINIIHADNGRHVRWVDGKMVVDKVDGWQDKIAIKSQLLFDCMDDDTQIYIVESGRPDGEKHAAPYSLEIGGGLYVIYTVCHWRQMQDFIRRRCIKNGKQFNKEFWQKKNCTYDGSARMLKQAAEFLVPNGVPHRIFSIDADRLAFDLVKRHIIGLLCKDHWYD